MSEQASGLLENQLHMLTSLAIKKQEAAELGEFVDALLSLHFHKTNLEISTGCARDCLVIRLILIYVFDLFFWFCFYFSCKC